MDFSEFELDTEIIKAIEVSGYTEATKIQAEAIPKILEGKDVRASAQTGTGKTAAFLLPALQKLIKSPNQGGKGPKILILTPTRELAQQITVQSEKYSKFIRNARSVCVVGGVPYHKQQAKLSRPYDILIATPGRLIDYMNRGKINFSNLEMVVLDEADRMLDMGFQEPVEEIISATPKDRQTLLFSATLQGEVLKLSQRFMKDPIEIVIHSKQEKHENIEQKLLYVDNLGHKNDLLDHLLNAEDLTSAIIFTATKRHCDELVDQLEDKDFYAGALHGDMNQRQRSRTIKMLKEGKINVLVATDVAARGLDIPSISHIINFDLPRDTEDYVHRIGRTGRAGKTGIAISFAGSKDIHMVPRIEKYTGQQIKVIEIAGLEPRQKPKATGDKSKSRNGRGGGNRTGRSSGGGFGGNRSGGGERRSSGGGFGGNRSGGGERRSSGGGFGGNRSGGGERRSSGGGFGGNRSGDGERRSSGSGFGGNRSEGGERRSSGSGFGGNRSEGGERRSSGGGFGGNRSGGGERRSSGGGYGGNRSEGGERRSSGGGYGGNRSDGGERRSSGGYGDRKESRGGSDRGNSGGYGGRKESFGGESRGRSSFGDSRKTTKRSDGENSRTFSTKRESSGGPKREGGFGDKKAFGNRSKSDGRKGGFSDKNRSGGGKRGSSPFKAGMNKSHKFR